MKANSAYGFLKGDSIVYMHVSLLPSAQSPPSVSPPNKTPTGGKIAFLNLAVTDGHELNPLLLAIHTTLDMIGGGSYWCSLWGLMK